MTPSRVEVYVNNQLVRVEQLPPGVYQLDHLPLPVGAGDTRVVVRDAFGGEQQFDSSFYISQGILARGVQQFSYAAGAERLDQFYSSWSYGRPMATGLHRIGLTDSVTVGGRFEAASDVASGGPMATVRLGRLGEVEGIGAMSHTASGAGYASSLAYEYTARPVRRLARGQKLLGRLRHALVEVLADASAAGFFGLGHRAHQHPHGNRRDMAVAAVPRRVPGVEARSGDDVGDAEPAL